MWQPVLPMLITLILAAETVPVSTNMQQDRRIGLWGYAQPTKQNRRFSESVALLFYFHGDSATLHLPPLKENTWRSEDDFYLVKTKWVGDRLFWLPPFGAWCELAVWRKDHFAYEFNGVMWRCQKIRANNRDPFLLHYLKKRKVHDYMIRENASEEILRQLGIKIRN